MESKILSILSKIEVQEQKKLWEKLVDELIQSKSYEALSSLSNRIFANDVNIQVI